MSFLPEQCDYADEELPAIHAPGHSAKNKASKVEVKAGLCSHSHTRSHYHPLTDPHRVLNDPDLVWKGLNGRAADGTLLLIEAMP